MIQIEKLAISYLLEKIDVTAYGIIIIVGTTFWIGIIITRIRL